jgi:uncharacterized membrane protein
VYRASPFYFGALLLLAIPAFWPTYFFPPKYESDWHVHVHGVAMFSWMALLIAQGALIRTRRNEWHRALGRVSYVLVPVMVVSTILLAHYRLHERIDPEVLYFFYVQVALMGVLAYAWAMAIRNRRQPMRHMRYMVCAALTVVDPIVARLLFFFGGIDFPPTQMVTFAAVDAILLVLIRRDVRERGQSPVYPGMLALFIATQLPTFFLYTQPGWRAFAEWFAALPLP